MKPNSLVVVIPTQGRPTLLGRTLAFLASCQLPATYTGTIVVENGDPCGVTDAVTAAPAALRARYMHSPAANKSAALNLVLETLDDSVVVFLDDDVRIATQALVAYATVADDCREGYFFGGPTAVDYEERPEDWLVGYLPPSARGWQWNGETPIVDRPAFLGFNWAAFSRDLQRVGGFDPTRGPGSSRTGQESEMQRRLLAGGLRGRYVPEALVWHYVPRERCSQSWAIQRRYRIALEQAIVLAGQGRAPSYWWYFLRYWLVGPAGAAAAQLSGSPHERFKWRYYASRDLGYLDALRTLNGSR